MINIIFACKSNPKPAPGAAKKNAGNPEKREDNTPDTMEGLIREAIHTPGSNLNRIGHILGIK